MSNRHAGRVRKSMGQTIFWAIELQKCEVFWATLQASTSSWAGPNLGVMFNTYTYLQEIYDGIEIHNILLFLQRKCK